MQFYQHPSGCLRVWRDDAKEYRDDPYDLAMPFEIVEPQVVRIDGLKGEMDITLARAIMAEAKARGIREIQFERIKDGRERIAKLAVR